MTGDEPIEPGRGVSGRGVPLGAGRALSVVAALLWFVQGFVPMVGRGAFSSSTTLDLVRLERAGRLGELLPAGVSVLLLLTPAAALVLLALAPWNGRAAAWGRAVTVLVGSVVALAQVFVVTGGDLGRCGPGAWCALAGAVVAWIAVAGCAHERRRLAPR